MCGISLPPTPQPLEGEGSLCPGSLQQGPSARKFSLRWESAHLLALEGNALLWVNAVGAKVPCLAPHGGQSQAFGMQVWRSSSPAQRGWAPRSTSPDQGHRRSGAEPALAFTHMCKSLQPWCKRAISPRPAQNQAKERAIVEGSSGVQSPPLEW